MAARSRSIKGLTTALAALACSCGPAHLSSGAHALVQGDEPMPASCQALGQVRGVSWNSLFFYDAPRSPALDAMRNASAARGGTHMVVHEITTSAHALVARGAAYRCPGWAPRDAAALSLRDRLR